MPDEIAVLHADATWNVELPAVGNWEVMHHERSPECDGFSHEGNGIFGSVSKANGFWFEIGPAEVGPIRSNHFCLSAMPVQVSILRRERRSMTAGRAH